jgi:hypothetical protein
LIHCEEPQTPSGQRPPEQKRSQSNQKGKKIKSASLGANFLIWKYLLSSKIYQNKKQTKKTHR